MSSNKHWGRTLAGPDRIDDDIGGGDAAQPTKRRRRILPWREPYATIRAFLTSRSIEERERRRPGLKGALREFRRSVFFQKRPQEGLEGWDGTTTIPDTELNISLFVMFHEICSNPIIDDETRGELTQAFGQIIDFKHERKC